MLNDCYGFTILGANDRRTKNDVAELNELLGSLGITFKLQPYEDTAETGSGHLGIVINNDTFRRARTRHAGRKKVYGKGKNYNCQPTVGEVFEWRKTMTHQQIIEKIGCPRATYYRRIKDLSKCYDDFKNCEADDFILSFKFF